MMASALVLNGSRLTLEEVWQVAEGHRKAKLGMRARGQMRRARRTIELRLQDEAEPHYGINTGFGSLKNVRIDSNKLRELQLNLIRSHCVGVGNPLPKGIVRAMMVLRAHTLSLGHSGAREQVAELLIRMLNRDIVPLVPEQGSVGASGDLAPLAHLALSLIGEGEVMWNGRVMAAKEALRKAGIRPLVPEPKEALSLLNGTQMITAVGLYALRKAMNALRHADVAAAMTLEATLGSSRAFDSRVHRTRPHPGQAQVAQNLRKLLVNSEIGRSHEHCDRVQDAYSIRCAPQVHGAARDALKYVEETLSREINSVTDNPLVFPEENEIISAGNFHGQPVAIALDVLAMALTPVASISERRTSRLLTPNLAELPPGLVEQAGLNSGLMMTQVTAAALVNECKTLSHPASVDSIPTWAEQEDHVSMGAFAARKAYHISELVERVVGIELLCAAQGLEFRLPVRPSRGVEVAWKAIRREIPPLKKDRNLSIDLESMANLVSSDAILSVVERNVGPIS